MSSELKIQNIDLNNEDESRTRFIPIIVTRFGIGMKISEWYDYRYQVFKAFGFDCLKYQTNSNFHWIIGIDDQPPNDFYEKICKDVSGIKHFHLIKVKNSTEYNKDYSKYEDFISMNGLQSFVNQYIDYIQNNILTDQTSQIAIIRKDDDDSLDINYIDNIHKYIKLNEIKLSYIDTDFSKVSISNQKLDLVKPLYYDIDQKGSWWNKHISNAFDDNIEITKHIYICRKGTNEIYVFYKNDFITVLGKPYKTWGPFSKQIDTLKEKVNKILDNNFIPFAYIINNPVGYCLHDYKVYDISYEGGTCFGICSILPVRNRKISHVCDYMYNNKFGHNQQYKSRGVRYINSSYKYSYIYFRSDITDSGDGESNYIKDSKDKYIETAFSDNLINKFKVNLKYLDIIKNYKVINSKKFKRVVDQNININ